LAAKYELDPPQVAAVVASMWAKHLDRPLTARKKKRELKPNSRYDQDSIANAEAAEEEEEEEQVEAEGSLPWTRINTRREVPNTSTTTTKTSHTTRRPASAPRYGSR